MFARMSGCLLNMDVCVFVVQSSVAGCMHAGVYVCLVIFDFRILY